MIKKETGEKREFSTGAEKQAAVGKGTPVLVPGDAILDLAKHFEEGAVLHGDRNWEKGIPLSELLNSAERHLQQIKMGLTDEAHDRAFAWNAIVYLATKLRIANGILPLELDDMPRYEDQRVFEISLLDKYCPVNGFMVEQGELGWYIVVGHGSEYWYLHTDLEFHKNTTGEPDLKDKRPGYYKTKKIAEAYLRVYLNKEKS